MKRFIVAFVFVCIFICAYIILTYERSTEDFDAVVEELIETMDSSDYNTMVCTKKGGDLFTEQKIYIKFNFDGLVDDVEIEEKYSSKKIAQSSYDTILQDEKNEEVMLDGTTVSYNATKSFDYEGKSKEEMKNIMNAFQNDGIHTGYIISWE